MDQLWLIFTTEPETKPSQEDAEVGLKSKNNTLKDTSKQENCFPIEDGEEIRKAEHVEESSEITKLVENSLEKTPKLKKKKRKSEDPHSERSELKKRKREDPCIVEETPKLKLKKKKQKSEDPHCITEETYKLKKKKRKIEGNTADGEKPAKKRKKRRSKEELEFTIEEDNSLTRRDTLKRDSSPGTALETVAPGGSVGEARNKVKKAKKRKKVESLDDDLERPKG